MNAYTVILDNKCIHPLVKYKAINSVNDIEFDFSGFPNCVHRYLCGNMWDLSPQGEITTGSFKCFEVSSGDMHRARNTVPVIGPSHFTSPSPFLQDVVREGEILFYPSEFYHQTFNVEHVSIAYSGEIP